MLQFLSINFFFLDFFNFCWVFQKFPFFCVTLYNTLEDERFYTVELHMKWREGGREREEEKRKEKKEKKKKMARDGKVRML